MKPDTLVESAFRLTKWQKAALSKLDIHTLSDLLFHFPNRYEDMGAAQPIAALAPNDNATVYGELSGLKKTLSWRTKKYVVEGTLTDSSGSIKIRWFNQPYVADMFEHIRFVKVTGKPTGTKAPYFANPTVEALPGLPAMFAAPSAGKAAEVLLPIYPESRGVSSRWFFHAIKKVLSNGVHEHIADIIPENVRKEY
ncbi:MAG: hypothetical protein Q8P16_00165, partial [bacterium]|nr:hypothetical protein [bacterium]